MKPPPFSYYDPASVEDAVKLLGTLDNAKILAGGQSLMPMLNMRFVVPDDGGRDIFVPGRVLPKTGVVRLEPNQRVHIKWHEGDKGPLATWVELI